MHKVINSTWRALGPRSLLAIFLVLVALSVQAAPASDGSSDRRGDTSWVSVPAGRPHPGQSCWQVYRHPVRFVADADDVMRAEFEFAGGAAHGSLVLSANDARLARSDDAYITEVRIGSYEPQDADRPATRLACRLSLTFHFYCPASDALDVLCYTWIKRVVP